MTKNLRNKWIEIIDEKKDEIIPIIVGRRSMEDEFLNKIKNSTNPEIDIAGIPTRKDSLAAVSLLIPENNAAVNVTPDLETPGNIARDCEIPSKTISFKLMLENDLFLSPYISEIARRRAITIETIEIENKPLKLESE